MRFPIEIEMLIKAKAKKHNLTINKYILMILRRQWKVDGLMRQYRNNGKIISTAEQKRFEFILKETLDEETNPKPVRLVRRYYPGETIDGAGS